MANPVPQQPTGLRAGIAVGLPTQHTPTSSATSSHTTSSGPANAGPTNAGAVTAAAAAATTTVLVADPLATSRAALSTELTGSGIGRVLQADSVSMVRDIIASGTGGQLALVSLSFGDQVTELINGLRQSSWPRVIAVTTTAESEPAVAAIQAGACGILRGNPLATPTKIDQAIKDLTEREIEVLTMVADGRSNKWIARQLALSPLTVKSHLARISRKLGTGDRSHLVAMAMRGGVIE